MFFGSLKILRIQEYLHRRTQHHYPFPESWCKNSPKLKTKSNFYHQQHSGGKNSPGFSFSTHLRGLILELTKNYEIKLIPGLEMKGSECTLRLTFKVFSQIPSCNQTKFRTVLFNQFRKQIRKQVPCKYNIYFDTSKQYLICHVSVRIFAKKQIFYGFKPFNRDLTFRILAFRVQSFPNPID